MVETKMNIKELKADIQKYLDENLIVEHACYDLATEPMIFYQEGWKPTCWRIWSRRSRKPCLR